MEEESLARFPDEVKEKCNILQNKLKSLHIATTEYVGNTKSQVNDLWLEGGRSHARNFRPVTPANVKVLLRLVAKDVGLLRQRFERWKCSNGPAQIWTKQIENRINELEVNLQQLIAEIAALKNFQDREDEEDEENERRRAQDALSTPQQSVDDVAESNTTTTTSTTTLPPLLSPTQFSSTGTASVVASPSPRRNSTCNACSPDALANIPSTNGTALRGILKRTRSERENTILDSQKRSIPTIGACNANGEVGDGSTAKAMSAMFPRRSHKALSRRSMSDSTLLGEQRRMDGVLPPTNGVLRRERTSMNFGSRPRKEYPRPSVVGYPFGSSFPELPPIWQLRRGRTMIAAKKPPENME